MLQTTMQSTNHILFSKLPSFVQAQNARRSRICWETWNLRSGRSHDLHERVLRWKEAAGHTEESHAAHTRRNSQRCTRQQSASLWGWFGKKQKRIRCEQDSNLRGNIPLDFKSNALTTRPSQLIATRALVLSIDSNVLSYKAQSGSLVSLPYKVLSV